MKRKILFLSLIGLMACNSSTDKKWSEASDLLNDRKLMEAITIFKDIVNENSKTHASKAQFQIAEIYLNEKKDYDIAIEEFEKVIEKYPNSTESKNALFMISYIQNNYLNAYSNAIINYNIFLKKYPADDLTPSVKYELKGLVDHQIKIDSLIKLNNK